MGHFMTAFIAFSLITASALTSEFAMPYPTGDG
jgi:hypothetical protein